MQVYSQEGSVKGCFACTLTRHLLTSVCCPVVTAALDAGPEADHNPAAVLMAAFASSAVIRGQVAVTRAGCQDKPTARARRVGGKYAATSAPLVATPSLDSS